MNEKQLNWLDFQRLKELGVYKMKATLLELLFFSKLLLIIMIITYLLVYHILNLELCDSFHFEQFNTLYVNWFSSLIAKHKQSSIRLLQLKNFKGTFFWFAINFAWNLLIKLDSKLLLWKILPTKSQYTRYQLIISKSLISWTQPCRCQFPV